MCTNLAAISWQCYTLGMDDGRVAIDGAVVRRLRKAQVLGQRELAELAGVTRETVAKLESGERVRSWPATARKLAGVLGVAPAALLKGTDDG